MDEVQDETAPHLAQKESSRASEAPASFWWQEGHRLLCGLEQGGTFGRGQGLLSSPWAGGTHLDLGFLGVCLNNLSSPYMFCSVRL